MKRIEARKPEVRGQTAVSGPNFCVFAKNSDEVTGKKAGLLRSGRFFKNVRTF
jgi:hypothetical protein